MKPETETKGELRLRISDLEYECAALQDEVELLRKERGGKEAISAETLRLQQVIADRASENKALQDELSKQQYAQHNLESERDTLRDLLVTCRIRAERAEKRLGELLRKHG
jgi:predicted RNase H-like nuclease (RuvC/YqgF family)